MPNKDKIVVYTTENCPYCDSAKQLLSRENYQYSEIDVADPGLRMMLVKKAHGKKTVPQIFIGALHVGGFQELQQLHRSGELASLLND